MRGNDTMPWWWVLFWCAAVTTSFVHKLLRPVIWLGKLVAKWIIIPLVWLLKEMAVCAFSRTIQFVKWLCRSPKQRILKPAITFAIMCVIVLMANAINYIFYDESNMPDQGRLASFILFEPPTTGHIYDVNDRSLVQLAKEYRYIVSYKEIPLTLEHAILSAEDKRFFQHDGIDKIAITKALFDIFVLGKRRGGSTITQQITRLYFLQEMMSREKKSDLIEDTLFMKLLEKILSMRNANAVCRKIEEIRIAQWLEKKLTKYYGTKRTTKEEILVRWASYVYVNNGRYGMRAGAYYYFGKELNELTAGEAALLAGITKQPNIYSPSIDRRKNLTNPKWRRDNILDLMVKNNFLFEREAEENKAQAIEPPKGFGAIKTRAPTMVGYVLEELRNKNIKDCSVDKLFEGRCVIYSTTNNRIQEIATETLESWLKRYESSHTQAEGLVQGAVVVLGNKDGYGPRQAA
jgi:penicillin-binding protein 1A